MISRQGVDGAAVVVCASPGEGMMHRMGGGAALQLRVIDRGRARVVQVGERAAGQPIRVGSAEDCDVRIPSAAPVHCELFIHRGQWVLRPTAGTAGGTWVNQKLVSKGAYLNTDDRIAFGTSADAAVIEVGPVAGVPVANAARPNTPDAIPELVAAGGATPGEETWLTEDEDEHVAFSVAASGEVIGSRSRGPRGTRRKSAGATGWTVLFTILVIAGAGAAVWKLRPTSPTPTPQPVAKQDVPAVKATNPVTLPVRETKNIFDNDWQKATAKSVAATDPRKREESWLAIEKAMDGPSPGRALYLIEEYRTTRPGVLDAELKGLTKTALDRIWWERILALCDRRDELRAEIQRLVNSPGVPVGAQGE